MTTKDAQKIVGDVIDGFHKIQSLSAVLEVDCCGGDEELIESWHAISHCNVVSNIARMIQEISQKQYESLCELEGMIRDSGKEASS